MIRSKGGQQYEFVGPRRHTRRDGTETFLAVWRTTCPQCGESFLCTTPGEASKFEPNRRCQKHKRPGQRAKGGEHDAAL